MRTIKTLILAMLLGASTTLTAAAQTPAGENQAPEAAPVEGAPLPPSAYAVQGGGCTCQREGSCLHRLLAWCTYCPKERVCFCKSCNTCQYKGALPINLIVGRYCREGNGMHATLPQNCCHGCKHGSCGAP